MSYVVTKQYGHDLGLSCAFRQWRAKSHCRQLHGYALAFTFCFGTDDLDECNWVLDFGGLKTLKAYLVDNFDHQVAVAADDPEMETFQGLERLDLVSLTILPSVGCEAFAKHAYDLAELALSHMPQARQRVSVISATCAEHAGNSATYVGD